MDWFGFYWPCGFFHIKMEMRLKASPLTLSCAPIEMTSPEHTLRVRVQDIFAQAEIHGRTPEEIVEGLPHLTLGQVHAALSYLHDHRAEILLEMREDEAFVSELRKVAGPSLLARRAQSPQQ